MWPFEVFVGALALSRQLSEHCVVLIDGLVLQQ